MGPACFYEVTAKRGRPAGGGRRQGKINEAAMGKRCTRMQIVDALGNVIHKESLHGWAVVGEQCEESRYVVTHRRRSRADTLAGRGKCEAGRLNSRAAERINRNDMEVERLQEVTRDCESTENLCGGEHASFYIYLGVAGRNSVIRGVTNEVSTVMAGSASVLILED